MRSPTHEALGDGRTTGGTDNALAAAAVEVGAHGVDTLTVVTDVSKADRVEALAAATTERFGAVHVVCNHAGVAGAGDPWVGPIETWE